MTVILLVRAIEYEYVIYTKQAGYHPLAGRWLGAKVNTITERTHISYNTTVPYICQLPWWFFSISNRLLAWHTVCYNRNAWWRVVMHASTGGQCRQQYSTTTSLCRVLFCNAICVHHLAHVIVVNKMFASLCMLPMSVVRWRVACDTSLW